MYLVLIGVPVEALDKSGGVFPLEVLVSDLHPEKSEIDVKVIAYLEG